MKGFIKTTLAVILGIFISGALAFSLLMGIAGSISLGSSKPTMSSDAVLSVDMSKIGLCEQAQENDPFAGLSSKGVVKLGILDAVMALDKAAVDPAIRFIYLKPDRVQCGISQLEEFREALARCKSNGKAIIAYVENPSNGGYYLASVADKVYMTSAKGASSQITGLSTQLLFLKDILDKLGVNVQLIRHGKYKSAGEMYIRNSISDENRTQYETLLNTIWSGWTDRIAESRGISSETFNALLDELKLNFPEDFLLNHLVDELLSKEEMNGKLCSLSGKDDVKDIDFISLVDYAGIKVTENFRAKEKVAVIYAEGNIQEGEESGIIDGDRFAGIIRKVRRDSSIKAVVLRVNSPGGSVLSADKVKSEIDLLRNDKPVIASYGDYAASGGYWISCSCDRIFSNSGTLTGSIGVFSMIPDFSKTASGLAHVNVTSIGTNRHSDMYSLMRPLDKDEQKYMQDSVEDIYDTFTGMVASGRKMEQSAVDEIAQGRVWAGKDALGIGLVDQIGTLKDALEYAVSVAVSDTGSDLAAWDIVSYPKPKTTIEALLESLGMSDNGTDVFSGTPFESMAKAFADFSEADYGKAYAMMPYGLTIK